ncbi:MAG: penicillin-binding protein 1A [Elainellaceae cyanobacterium]
MNRPNTPKLSWFGSLWSARAERSPADLADAQVSDTASSPASTSVRGKRSRRRSPSPRPKRLDRRYWLCASLGVVVGVAGSGYFTTVRMLESVRRDLPNAADVLTYARDGTLTIQADDGTILHTIGPATREKVAFDAMPDRLVNAFIASEDKNFYEHNGVDYWAIVRAARTNIRVGEVVEGASTITQQLARIVFLDQDRTYERKLREALLAQKMEQELEKDSILGQYLNLVYLGSGAYGVADAAWVYFSKSVDDLTLSEAALIAGLPPAPTDYSPLVNPDLALQRRDVVLNRMVEAEFITPAERDAAIAESLTLNPSEPKYFNSEIPYFTIYIQQQLPDLISQDQLELGGLVIETTLNLEWQRIAEETIENAIANYGTYEAFEQAALVSLDPRTGEIKAMVGGTDFDDSQFNRVTQAQRQPGSTFKTFVYAAAIASGMSPYKTYEDAPFKVDGYEPQNYGRSFRGTISIRDALISSINVVAVKTLIDVGFAPVVDVATKMGIQSTLMPTYSMALGASEVNLLEMTSAYGTLAAEGLHAEPHGILRVTNRYGTVIYEAEVAPERAIGEDTAAIVTWMLQGVVQNGTGVNASLPGRPVAGKTGTSENYRDLWFVGYIPQLVTGVWLGNDDSTRTWGSSATAALTWHDFMSRIVDDLPVESFPELPPLEGRTPTVEAQPVRGQVQTPSASSSSSPPASSGSWSEEPAAPSYEEPADQGYSPPPDSAPAPAPQDSFSEGEPAPPVEEPPAVDVPPEVPALDLPPPAPESSGAPVPVEPGLESAPLQ